MKNCRNIDAIWNGLLPNQIPTRLFCTKLVCPQDENLVRVDGSSYSKGAWAFTESETEHSMGIKEEDLHRRGSVLQRSGSADSRQDHSCE